jgi:putative N6-adenine-specific DNA methylase
MPVLPKHACYAITPPGIEGLAAAELRALGILPDETEFGGVAFTATTRQLYVANLELRTASRILVRLSEFPARAFYELERKAKRVPWADVLPLGAPVRFRVTSRKSRLYHEDGIAERLLESMNAQRSTVGGTGPDDDEAGDPNAQLFVVRIVRDLVTISADSSGELLHRRGYRLATAKAPLRETLAAAMLLGAGYDGTVPLLDPFCGAGTIPIEAALIARRIAPGLRRHFAFERWPGFDSAGFAELRADATLRILPTAPAQIVGSDQDTGAVVASHANAERAGVAADVTFREAPLTDLAPLAGSGLLITNPPYGVRVGKGGDLRDLYARLGALFTGHRSEWTLAMLSADSVLERECGLSFSTRWESNNGGLRVRLVMSV